MSQTPTPMYRRILVKLSGEALMGEDSYGINRKVIVQIVGEIKQVAELGVQIGVVIGGGNIFRGMAPAASGMDRATADYMGMLATVMNALALTDAMQQAPAWWRACNRALAMQQSGRALRARQGHAIPRRR